MHGSELRGSWESAGSAFAGDLLGKYWLPASKCHCHCEVAEAHEVSAPVLQLLEKQLERCGPENLRVAQPSAGVPFTVVVIAFFVGIFLGGLLVSLVSGQTHGVEAKSEGYVEYPPEALLHERLLLCHSFGSHWAILTPNQDVYMEDLVSVNFGILSLDNRTPAWAARRQCYAFPDFEHFATPVDWADFFEEGITPG